MSDSPEISARLAKGFFAFVAFFAGLLAGAVMLGFLYDDARHRYNVYYGDMDFGGAIFAILGAFLGAASGIVLYSFCTRSYQHTGITALAIWLLFSPVGGLATRYFMQAIHEITLKSDSHAQFDLALSMPIIIWWFAFLGCGIAALLASRRVGNSSRS